SLSPVFFPSFFFFYDTATTQIYTLSLHDALPISPTTGACSSSAAAATLWSRTPDSPASSCASPSPASAIEWKTASASSKLAPERSEEHTSELQSLAYLVCRLLLEKKKKKKKRITK